MNRLSRRTFLRGIVAAGGMIAAGTMAATGHHDDGKVKTGTASSYERMPLIVVAERRRSRQYDPRWTGTSYEDMEWRAAQS